MMTQNNLAFTEDQAIPEGYKKTDQGLLPQSWNIVAIRTLVSKLDAGISVNSVDSLDAYSHGKHVLKTSCVAKGYFLPNEKKSILPIDINRAKTIPEKGSIIVSRMNTPELVGELGYVHVFDENIYLPDRLWQMIFKKDQQLCSRWLAYLLSSKKFSKQIKESATGTSNSMKNISKEILLSLEIPYPKFDEQEKIATALSDTDSLISELEKLIEKKQAIKTATMQQLLTGKTRLPEFVLREDGVPKAYKESELGQIPEDWEIKQLGEFVEITSGESPSKFDFINNGIPYFKVEQLNNGDFYAESTPYYVKLGKTISAGSLVFPKRGASILSNKIRILKVDACMDTNLMALTCDPELNPNYLLYALTYSGLDKVADTTSIPQINNKHVLPYKIFYPSLIEQVRISNILVNLENDIELSKQKVEKLRKIKLGMMQELLTGKTRLV
ncbi:restriction endonuclease subunit S [Acinetobacter ursingii]|uniref:restriction endonuclease subunit S n=1 Tax=Acinetobacter ursingii TaxID=108980 RepID=UPI003009CDBE